MTPDRLSPGPPALTSSTAEAGDPAIAEPGRQRWVFGQRRNFLVDKRAQLRAGLMTVTVVLVLVVLLNLSLHASRMRSAQNILASAPELEQVIRSQNRAESLLLVLASAVFLAGVFVVTILETHKTTGAAYNLARRLEDVRAGRYGARLRLRKGDNLRELEASFNEMSLALQDEAWRDVEALDELARTVERAATPEEIREVATALRRIADGKRRRAE